MGPFPRRRRIVHCLALVAMHATAGAQNVSRAEADRLLGEARALHVQAVDAPPSERPAATARARVAYARAAQAFARLLEGLCDAAAERELRYFRAESLYGAARYDDAARDFGAVRDGRGAEARRAPAAYMAVLAREEHLRSLAREGRIAACDAARAGVSDDDLRDASGRPRLSDAEDAACRAPLVQFGPTATRPPIPEAVQTLLRERRAFCDQRVSDPLSEDPLRVFLGETGPNRYAQGRACLVFRLRSAMTQANFGLIEDALRFYSEALRHCGDPTLRRAAGEAQLAILKQLSREDLEYATERLSGYCFWEWRNLLPPGAVGGARRARLAMQTFREIAQAPPSDPISRYADVARALDEAAPRSGALPEPAGPWVYRAHAHERAGAPLTAIAAFRDVLARFDHENERRDGPPLDPELVETRVEYLHGVHHRLAVTLLHVSDLDGALEAFRAHVEDPALAATDGPGRRVFGVFALWAELLTELRRWPEVLAAWRGARANAATEADRALADYRAAEVSSRAGRWTEAIPWLEDYLTRAPVGPTYGPFRVRAWRALAMTHAALSHPAARDRCLREALREFRASGLAPGADGAADAAAAGLLLHAPRTRALVGVGPRVHGAAPNTQRLATFQTRLTDLDAALREVAAVRGGEASIEADFRRGELHARHAELLEATAETSAGDAVAAREQAVRAFAAALHQARDAGDPTPIALRAWARLRDEANADVLRRLRTRGEAPFTELARFLDNDSPGALTLQTTQAATPGLDTHGLER